MKPTVTPVPSPNRLLEKRNAQGRHVPSPQAGWGDVVPLRGHMLSHCSVCDLERHRRKVERLPFNGSVLCILPFDRATDRRLLVSRPYTRGCNRTHGLDKLSGRPLVRRSYAAFIEPTAILELAVGIVTEEVRRTDCPIAPCDCLRLVVKIGKREIMSLRETLHILK